jgi:hypothetical protein
MVAQLQSTLLASPKRQETMVTVVPKSHHSPARSISPMLVAQYT